MTTVQETRYCSTISLVLSFLLGSAFTLLTIPVWRNSWQQVPDNVLVAKKTDSRHLVNTSNQYWDAIQTGTAEERVFQGGVNYSSKFTGPPSSQVEDAWAEYWQVWSFWVAGDEMRSDLLPHPEELVMVEGDRLDPPRYIAMTEAVHQLHCLFNLFRATNLDHYHDEAAFARSHPEEWHQRVNHCIEILRQKLECDWDPHIIPFRWSEATGRPEPDFNVRHSCRSSRASQELLKNRQVEHMPSAGK